MNKRTFLSMAGFAALVAGAALAAPQAAVAQSGPLSLYCSVQIEWCQLLATEFEKQKGIKVEMQRKSTGETLAQIRAEARNPRGDVWFGGTGDPHLQAAE